MSVHIKFRLDVDVEGTSNTITVCHENTLEAEMAWEMNRELQEVMEKWGFMEPRGVAQVIVETS